MKFLQTHDRLIIHLSTKNLSDIFITLKVTAFLSKFISKTKFICTNKNKLLGLESKRRCKQLDFGA